MAEFATLCSSYRAAFAAILRLFPAAVLSLALYGCSGSSGDSETPKPEPDPDVSADVDIEDPVLPERGTTEWEEAQETARFLMQTTFGPTPELIVEVMQKGRDEWLEEQFSLPASEHLERLDQRFEAIGLDPTPEPEVGSESYYRDLQRSDVWWEIALWGEDQLRQRVAFALSQIFVISNEDASLGNDSRGIASYHDMLARHAFGNYRELLEAVTLHPMMAEYLSMARNHKADEARNLRPDENYAREMLQLFSIGTVQLNPDGSRKLDSTGSPIPTYDQQTVEAFARVFTGWNLSGADNWWRGGSGSLAETKPMIPFEDAHDTDEKVLLNDEVIPAGQTAREDLELALDNVFHHPNVGPFIGKQLIQRLVTSNPSPAYVERVARAFNDNGDGVRGDLQAVVRAIITDPEARDDHNAAPDTFGKVREPLLQYAHIWRAFEAQGVAVEDRSGTEVTGRRIRYRNSDGTAGQRPYGAHSVFNFYRPDYSHGGAMAKAGLRAPEFQIHTESLVIAKTNQLTRNIFGRDSTHDWNEDNAVPYTRGVTLQPLDLADEKSLAADAETLVDRLDLVLTAGQLPDPARKALVKHVAAQPLQEGNEDHVRRRFYEAASLIVASPYFAVQR